CSSASVRIPLLPHAPQNPRLDRRSHRSSRGDLGLGSMPHANHYDVIIIGSGAGGGTLAYALADTEKRILILERGTSLPREKENLDAREVFVKERYHTTEVWYDRAGKSFRPGTNYWVGGNTKLYGAVLLRFRERDFGQLEHHDGISPEWPLKYADFAPYY